MKWPDFFNPRKNTSGPQTPEYRAVEMMVVYEEGEPTPWETSSIPDHELSWSKSVCPYCGVGCGLLAGTKDGKVHKVRGNPQHPANNGLICAKGASLPQVLDTPDRLLFPFVRASADAEFKRCGWDEALGGIAAKIRNTIERHGADSFAFYISGQLLTEDYYVINKLAKGFFGTNNVDSNSRLCMASAAAAYALSFGADGPPACYADLEISECFFLIGTNTAACHPIVFQRIKNAKAKNPKVRVIVTDPRKTQTAEIADLYLPLRPGTDVALLNGMLHVLERAGLLDEAFIASHTSGWPELKETIREYTPERTAGICGLKPLQIVEAARMFGASPSALSLWSMGLNQSTSGVAKNRSVINLHLATGKIGKPGSGPFSLTGQPNAMGGRETGGLSNLLPAHRHIVNEKHRQEMEKFWKVPARRIAPKPGLTAIELFRAVDEGKVKIVWIIATNPMVSIPNLSLVKSALAKAELVIVQDPYHPTETTQTAHVILPAAQWSERNGTLTNSERRISLVDALTSAPGESLPDWEIIARFARHMGFAGDFEFDSAESVFEEYKQSTRGTDMDITGVSYARLKKEFVQWPSPDSAPVSTARLYTDGRFHTPDGKASFAAHDYDPPAETPGDQFPFVLTTGRVRDQWHTMTRTGKVDALLKNEPYSFLEIHPEDAARLGIAEHEMVEVRTRRGSAKAPARITDRVNPGVCFMPFHWGTLFGDTAVNRATADAFDPVSKQPELKYSACRLEKAQERVVLHAR